MIHGQCLCHSIQPSKLRQGTCKYQHRWLCCELVFLVLIPMMINLPAHLEARLESIEQKIADVLDRVQRCEQRLQLMSCQGQEESQTLSTYMRREASIPTLSPYEEVRLSLSQDSILCESGRMDTKTFRVMKDSILLTSEELKRIDIQMFKIKGQLQAKINELEQGIAIMSRILQVLGGEENSLKGNKINSRKDSSKLSNKSTKRQKDKPQGDRVLQKYLPAQRMHHS